MQGTRVLEKGQKGKLQGFALSPHFLSSQHSVEAWLTNPHGQHSG